MVRWCYAHDVAIVPRGGGTGLTGGAVPTDGGVVLSLERLRAVRELEPGLWRMLPEAGVSTRDVQRLARENGLFFAPRPGRLRAVADRRQRRDQRGRAARVEVRRDRRLGDRPGGRCWRPASWCRSAAGRARTWRAMTSRTC